MMGYKVTVDIKSSDFPMLGIPAYPKTYTQAKDILPKEVKNKVKDQYESYYRNATKARDAVMSDADIKNGISGNVDEMAFSFNYEEGIPKTYKFLGMDIDDNYTAVIVLGDGYVSIAPMFSIDDIIKESVPKYGRFESSTVQVADDIIKKSSAEVARTLSTAMKNGALYDIFRSFGEGSENAQDATIIGTRKIRLENLDPLVQLVKSKLNGTGSSGGTSSVAFKSVLLNLVDREKRRDQESKFKDTGSSSDMDTTVAAVVLCKIFSYWRRVATKYTAYYSTFSELDLWSSLGKVCMGENAFNSQIRNTGIVVQSSDTGEILDGKIISFAGVSRDGGINDSNTYRLAAQEQLTRFSSVISGNESSIDVSLQDIMLGNIEYEDFGNPFELSAEELQAISSYDSLKYIDEDANSCRESYNMNDPEERSMFIKSAIKSYDRNFRAFKSHNDYDVAQAFSDMVERGVTFSDRIVSKNTSGEESDLDSYEVTSSQSAIDRVATKKTLVKVGKLLNRSLTDVYDLFSSTPQKSTNP